MPRRIPTGATLLVLLLTPALLRAQDSDLPRIRFGLQVTGARPQNDLRGLVPTTAKGIGIFFDQAMDEDWNVRTRIDYLSFGSTSSQAHTGAALVPPLTRQHDGDQSSLGAEVRYHPRPIHGAFILGGMAMARYEFESIIPADPSATPPTLETHLKVKSSTKLSLSAGAGYQFTNNLAATVRYTTMNLDGTILSTLEGGLEYRF
jgi:opacity protein-like surface antigen